MKVQFLSVLFFIMLSFRQVYGWCFKFSMIEVDKIRCIDYSPDGSMIAVGMDNNAVKVFDASSYVQLTTFNAPARPTSCKFNGLSTFLAVGSLSSNIVIMTVSTWGTQQISASQTQVYSVTWNNDSTTLAACGKDNELRMWTVSGWSAVTPAMAGQGSVDFKVCQFTSDNKLIIGDNGGIVKTYQSPYLVAAQVVSTTVTYGAILPCLANRWTTLDYIVTDNTNKKGWASFDNSNSIISVGGTKSLDACAYAKTLDYFMMGGSDKKVFIFNATSKNNQQVQNMLVNGNILSADFSDDGRYLAVGADDNVITIYSQYCLECDVSYYYNSSTKICDTCESVLPGCGICYSATTCASCSIGFYITAAKTCTACYTPMIGCAICTNSSYCTVPVAGYYLASNVPATCEGPLPGCLICNSSTVCLECYADYYLNSNKCVSCTGVANCLKCYNNTFCAQCQQGYYPNPATTTTSVCARCSANCLNCQTASICYECTAGFYTAGAGCLSCPTNCLVCNNSNFCLSCVTRTFVTTTGTCSSCTAPCLSCVTSATTCLSCFSGYYFDGTSTCVICPSGCSSCTSGTNCMTCVEGFYFSSNSCTKCTTTYPNCLSCTSASCSACLTSFYYDSTTTACKSCGVQMHGCVQCSSATACLFCAPGHYLSALTGNSSCQPCAIGCSTCEDSSNCSACTPGYFYNSVAFTCPKCTALCMTCKTSTTFCESCIIGYYLSNSATGTCTACNATKAYCLACAFDSSNILQCIECGVGFFLDSATGSCSRCNSNCLTCSAASTCLSCELGAYFNSTDSTCKSCSPTCAECSVNGTCESCYVGYYLSSPNCLSCSSVGCLTCRADTKCLSCSSGFYLVAVTLVCDKCSTPLTNCLSCSSSTVCTQCAYGYALTTSGATTTCSSCSSISGCYHCSSSTVCVGCQSGYYLNGNVCTACIDGCRICSNSTYCMECGNGYFSGNILGGANVGTCLRCQFYLDGCELCKNNTSCANCQSGYYSAVVATNTVCKLCEVNIPYCTLCDSSTICTSCKGGYYLAADKLSCIQCSTTFSACQLCNRLGTACTSCDSGYYLSAGTCLLCNTNLAGCQICSSSSTCIDCDGGYYLASGACQLCSSQMSGCIFCSSSTVCQQCEAGYYLDPATFKCLACSVVGCEVCVESSPTQCVTCNSLYYKATATTCGLCRTTIPGCLTCSSSTACSKCDVGYYQNGAPPPQCALCSDVMEGCSICSSSTACLECKSMYFLNTATNRCQICSQSMTGCTFCVVGTACLACGSGFFLNTNNLCQPCTDITGCLVCKNANQCLFCDTGYYFNSFTCNTCNIISGCYSCISSTICTSCVGGYTLNSASGCDVTKIQGVAEKVTDIMLKTFYVNSTTLKHFLYAKDMAFTKVSMNWQTNMTIFLFTKNNIKIPLTVKDVSWATDNNYTMIIYTNNPIDYSSKTKQMPFTMSRRLLSFSIDLSDTKTGIELSEEAVKKILPNYQHSGSLLVDYGLDSPEFYASYTNELVSDFPYFAIGAAFVALLFIKYLIKALVTVPNSPNIGNIIPHILAFKVGSLLLFPTFVEYINYCSGFMYADFPWLNRYFGEMFSDKRDVSPEPYTLFYDNMNLGSMYLLPVSIFVFLLLVILLIGKNLPKYEYKMNSSLSFIYNFFAFGMFFAGCGSLQGAIKNPIQSLTLNSAFYILGILVYFSMLCESIYRVSQDKVAYFYRIRILFKATLLSLSHLSPIYLLSSTVVLDLVLIMAELKLSSYSQKYFKSWLFSNIICNLALVLLVFLPIIQLTMIVVSGLLFLAIVAEGVLHYQEARDGVTVTKLQNTEAEGDRDMWDLNFTDKELGRKESSDQISEKGKTALVFDLKQQNEMATKYTKKSDMEETKVMNNKYSRVRNYKRARDDSKAKRLQLDIGERSNPSIKNEDDDEMIKEENLNFVLEDANV